MRLDATEDDMYGLMDKRDCSLFGAIACGVAAGMSLYGLLCGEKRWDCVYLLLVFLLGVVLLVYQMWDTDCRVMETKGCYLELDQGCLVVCQPEKCGRYESCRIFYGEIKQVIEGSRRGVPEFYVIIKKLGDERKSFILLDDREEERLAFRVCSLGYGKQEFTTFYRQFRQKLPENVPVLGTELQEVWGRKKICAGTGMAAAAALAYMIPKLIEIMDLL